MSLIAEERETTVNYVDDGTAVIVWSCVRKHITKMRKHEAFTEIESGEADGTPYAKFTVPADRWGPTGVTRKLNLTEEQRAERALRMKNNRTRETSD